MKSKPLKYYSTNRKSTELTFSQALLKGLAPDGGLYMPLSIPKITREELESFTAKEYHEIAFSVLNKFLSDETDNHELMSLCRDAYIFEVPLEKVCERKYIMRLDQGPTASFKDFASRMMSRLMQYYLSINNQHLTILTATSGDTGSAVASAFYGLKNINVIILFPDDEVSLIQRKQMTTLQDNIKVIAINGKFDDCQRLVKKAFLDLSLSQISLSSANSINIGRLLPQSVYYFYAWSRLSGRVDDKTVFSVPSGNFGNLMGGLIASKMGLPVKQFIVSTNENNEVPEFLRTGNYKSIIPSKNCISSAMNVGHPSNLARIVALYGGMMDETGNIIKVPDLIKMREDLFAVSVTDEETKATIADIYKQYNILLEPHGAIAWHGINEYFRFNKNINSEKQLCISLETAHPAKFPEEIRQIINVDTPLPASLIGIAEKTEKYFSLENNYEMLKDFILKHY
ncbi:MAG: threonine synthase [Bacteroidales bacterium]|nr:threonine synthase [Bacteroidales bacterium]